MARALYCRYVVSGTVCGDIFSQAEVPNAQEICESGIGWDIETPASWVNLHYGWKPV